MVQDYKLKSNKFVIRIRQSHISFDQEIEGEIKRVKKQKSLLYKNVYEYLRFKGELAIGNSDLELGHHLHQGGNDYLDIYLRSMEDVEKCKEILKNPIRIFQDRWCDTRVYFKKLFTIDEYVKLGTRDKIEIEKLQCEKLNSEPHITLKFYLSEPKDSEDVDTIIDWLRDQLEINNMSEVNFEKSYIWYEDKDDVELILPVRLREEVIKFMVNTFDVPNIGTVTIGPKVLKEPTPIKPEDLSEKLDDIDWENIVKITDFKLKGTYSEDNLEKLSEVYINTLKDSFIDFAKNDLIDSLNKEQMDEYIQEQKDCSVFEEKIYQNTDVLLSLFSKLQEYKDGVKNDLINLFNNYTKYINDNKEEYINIMKSVLTNLKTENNNEEIDKMVDEYLAILDSQEGDIARFQFKTN